jgi:F-type H+-transporting ATPase subunit alpha
VEVLKQHQFAPLPFSKQILIIFAGTNGHFDDLADSDVRPFEAALYAYVETMNPALFKTMEEKKALDDALRADMNKTIREAKERFLAEKTATAAAAK